MVNPTPAITRVLIENYKSIAHGEVELGPLTFLVGPNGAGKSNFLDALRFVSDALRTSLDAAIRDRGSFQDLRFKGADPDAPVHLFLEVALPNEQKGQYSLSLVHDQNMGYRVAEEKYVHRYLGTDQAPTGFHLRDGFHVHPSNWPTGMPAVQPKQLYLPLWPDLTGRRPGFEVLAGMAFYDPIPAHMRNPERHDQGDRLLPDGSNCASVLLRLAAQRPRAMKRITEYLQAILPGLRQVQGMGLGGYDVLTFTQLVVAQEQSFPPLSVSDGTLHALAVLTALFQANDDGPSLVAIEEPEAALHSLATGVLLDGLRDASEDVQVIVTTHSPDILDDKDIDPASILVVVADDGVTTIGPLDEQSRRILQDRLLTVGEMARRMPLRPQPVNGKSASEAKVH